MFRDLTVPAVFVLFSGVTTGEWREEQFTRGLYVNSQVPFQEKYLWTARNSATPELLFILLGSSALSYGSCSKRSDKPVPCDAFILPFRECRPDRRYTLR